MVVKMGGLLSILNLSIFEFFERQFEDIWLLLIVR